MHFTYLTSKHGSDLEPGDIIIANQSYGIIYDIDQDFIYTSAGKRKFFPSHLYPVFSQE